MFIRQSVIALTFAVALQTFGAAQTAPPAPSAPPAPRVLRGSRSITTQSMAKHGYLGVGVVEVTSDRAKALKLPADSGVEVMRVDEDSPASKAGLKVSDVILELNGRKVDEIEQFVQTIVETSPGDKADMVVWRNGGKQNVTARIDSRRVVMNGPAGPLTDNFIGPNGPQSMQEIFPNFVGDSPRAGFEGEMLTPQLAEFFGVKQGVLVRTVNGKSPAERAGLKAGDVVTKVNGTPVSSPREVSSLLRASHGKATFTVTRNHKEIMLNVEIAEDRSQSPDRLVL